MARKRYDVSSVRRYRPPSYQQSGYTSMDETTDACSRFLQLLLVTVATLAMVFTISTVDSCEFLYFFIPNLVIKENHEYYWNSTTAHNLYAAALNIEEDTKIAFGLFKFEDPFYPTQCYVYSEEKDYIPLLQQDMPVQAQIARWSVTISSLLTICALFILCIEICCCRFVCSRVLVNMSFLAAFLGIPPAFLLYTQGVCNVFSNSSYKCQLGEGAIHALTAMGLLLAGIIISCLTPKSTPVIRVIQEREKRMIHDPCCCCPGKSKEEILQEDPSMLLAALPSDHVEVSTGEKGVTYSYKHYFDDQSGGVTLQSQYTAASNRWLECDRNYADALSRFKQECQDAAEFLQQNKSSDNNPHRSDWRYVLQLPLEDVDDPELARQRQVLETLKSNCDQARRVMDLIEEDLEAHIKPENDKLAEALKQIELNRQSTSGIGAVAATTSDDDGNNNNNNNNNNKGDNSDALKKEEEADLEAATTFEEPPEPLELEPEFDPPEIGEDEAINGKDGNDAYAESFPMEDKDDQFRSALMVMKESKKGAELQNEDVNRPDPCNSWISSMFYSSTEGDETYKKIS